VLHGGYLLHTCSCTLWTTLLFLEEVMEHSPREIILLFSHSSFLEGAHMEEYILLFYGALHVGGCNHFNILSFVD
jgi:hypothetical protein